MVESRIPRARLILGALAAVLLSACGDATESPPGDSRAELERDLRQETQDLQNSRETLAAAEQRIAGLQDERSRDRRRLAELTATFAGLERRNRDLGQQLTRNGRRVRELSNERRALRSNLAKAHGEIRGLRARQTPGQREIADLRYRGAATARELGELRRYNAFLLQERGNLQAWLQEANATREQQRDALQRVQQDADRIKSSAEAANQRLRVELEKANQSLAELAKATRKIAMLRAARDYLVEKIEACALQQQSSSAKHLELTRYLTLPGALVRSSNEAVSRRHNQGRLVTAQWQPGTAIGLSRHARLIPVATHTDEQPGSTRRERELDRARKKVEELELELEALTEKLQELETEYATIKKQVQTLTWANEVLVKELEAAYKDREAGSPSSLPEGSRGIYVVQRGESLSRIANAFYGDPGRWRDLVEANKDKIPDPDMLEPGTTILIPE